MVAERRSLGDNAVELVVDVAGVGYRVLVTPRTAAGLAVGAGGASLSVHTHVREGAITLYGFCSPDERATFELLIAAHGVGPGLALAILGVHGPAELAEVVATNNVDALKLVPGVGQKTAARLLLELAARFDQLGLDGAAGPVGSADGRAPTAAAEVGEALAQLGYGPEEVRAALRSLPGDGTVEELLRIALRSVAPRRRDP